MARKKSDADQYVTIHQSEYYALIKDSLLIKALKTAGLENMDIYKGISSIVEDGRIEIHLQEIKKRYR